MRIERISSNQIRCTLSGVDLGNRNLNLGELAYGSDAARALFQEMLTRASYEVGFEADDSPLMVEAIPLSNESVMIYVTKVEDPDELDTRFARFSPQLDDMVTSFDIKVNDLLEGALDLGREKANTGEAQPSNTQTTVHIRAYEFDSLDGFIEGAKAVGAYCGESTLYKDDSKKRYILVLKKSSANEKDFAVAANILSEYGHKLPATALSEIYYKEHFKVLIKENALSSMASI